MSFANRLQPVVPRENVVLPAKLFLQLRLGLLAQPGILDELVNVLVQVRVHELQLRRAVLVVKRHSRAVLDRLLEVVDRNVIAEHFLSSVPRPRSTACR